ncbi:molybdopterin molybdotransferase MoeA [Streptacidiphilus sp. PB12-B1b]|uniref:molybdopterin molybdotransferase MoeA n=1 Tax=Streptacidiphilus sp. PB12-B1b TaxID=2705012 RepID=UPI0015FCF35F|nr:molybdopterin molybdotransferase MoeA [Streptacidiphilus sp. PB12-B1b]QMU79775.1 molybdopterin molybdotransferase MoeA [Streptacidiphilus sp. PB12-B1b]
MSVDSAPESDLLSSYPFLVRSAVPAPADPPAGAASAADLPYDHAAADDRHDPAAAPPGAAPRGPGGRDDAGLPWPQARRRALRAAGAPLEAVRLPLADALGGFLAAPLEALTDLPAFDTSAMDGWAVSGPGPWLLDAGLATGPADPDARPAPDADAADPDPNAAPDADPAAPQRSRPPQDQLLAGQHGAGTLADGTAVRIATGAQLPPGATAVLRSEDGRVRPGHGEARLLHDGGARPLDQGRDIRPRGQECHSGEPLLPPGTAVTPAVLGLAAAAGCDELTVYRRPTVELLVLGDELLDSGLPREGRIRDALGPLLPSWLRGYGARILAVRRVGDDLGLLRDALRHSPADVVVTTGGTAAGPVDFLHSALAEVGARLLVDGVQVRPGHPMVLAALPSAEGQTVRRHLIGLPGNPLAAVAGAATLAEPLLRALAGCPPTEPYLVRTAAPLPGHREDTRLVPVVLPRQGALPLSYDGPAMLRGLALAEGLAVVPPGGLPAGAGVEVLEVPAG